MAIPTDSRLVVASDLLTHRNISNPTRITVKLYTGKYKITKGMSPMNSGSFTISDSIKKLDEISALPANLLKITYPAVFYGRGRGIHGTTPFTGIMLKELLATFLLKMKRT